MASIGDVFLRLLADDKGFAADVERKAGAAGDKAGKTLGQRMGKGLSLGLTALGAAGGALFSLAAKGANDLTNAMASFQAETGATQEELESARASVLALSKTNLQSFEEIAAAQARLRTDLGLTQAEAEAATEAFLKYGTATGRDAAEGVGALDDILDAWNLDASKSGEIMDKLVASHQKYGGSITDNEKALNNLAPQLQALNLDVDDGIGLLNLFAEGGLDASKAQFALNSAIQKLPPGTSLEEFIAQLAAIEDPGERARKAIEVFGARGGAGLANVIRPGMEGLGDFAISMDEAANATNEAAVAIENTPFNQLKMALRSIAAPAIEAGQAFGPLILALSQLGGGKVLAAAASGLGGLAGALTSKLGPVFGRVGAALGLKLAGTMFAGSVVTNLMGDSLGSALGKLPGSSAVKSGMGKLGRFMGSGLGKAFGVAFAAVAVVEVVNTYNEVKANIDEQSAALAEQAKTFAREASLEALKASREGVQAELDRMGSDPVAEWLGLSAKPAIIATLAELDRAIAERSAEIPGGISGSLAAGKDEVEQGAAAMMAGLGAVIGAGGKAGATVGNAITGSLAERIRAGRDKVDASWNLLMETIKGNKGSERAKTIGRLLSTELAKAMKSKDPLIRAQAEETQQVLLDRLEQVIPKSGKVGKKTMDQLRDGLRSKNPAIRAQAQKILSIVNERLNKAPAAARKDGRNTGQAFADGMRKMRMVVKNAAVYMTDGARTVLRAFSPPGPDSPLHLIDKWGEGHGQAFAEGLESQADRVRRAAQRLVAGAEGEFTGGRFGIDPVMGPIPALSGAHLRMPVEGSVAGGFGSLSAAAVADSQPSSPTINVNLLDRMPAHSVRDIGSGLRMLEDQGYLGRRR